MVRVVATNRVAADASILSRRQFFKAVHIVFRNRALNRSPRLQILDRLLVPG